ncbi:MAG: hypothetical protein QMD14_01350 [Candidatus Aenigmarchaeota archaeon]|nr:hypothetical protein [Candidatus Aenigmarchaeota archaeon]
MLKAQAAMEYLMTYGWAILIVVVVVAALYWMGPLNPATWMRPTATGFGEIGVPEPGAWRLKTDGSFVLLLTNNVGARINITGAVVKLDATDCTGELISGASYKALDIREGFNVTATCAPAPSEGAPYRISVELTYDNLQTGLKGFKDSGTLTGRTAA